MKYKKRGNKMIIVTACRARGALVKFELGGPSSVLKIQNANNP